MKNNSVKFLCLICVLLFTVDGFAQGQITRRPFAQRASKPTTTTPAKNQPRQKTQEQNTRMNLPKGFVDLGLPSGTLWKATNESDFYDYYSAVSQYGCQVPSQEQWTELKDYCKWVWIGNGYRVSGNNGQFIVLPAAGYRGCGGDVCDVGTGGYYWSYAPRGSERAWGLDFKLDEINVYSYVRCNGLSVRLVYVESVDE